VVVPGTASFAEMLEAELNCTRAPRSCSAWNRPLTTPIFLFEQPRPATQTPTHAHAPSPKKPARLSAREMRSLAALNDLGAGLGNNLSSSSLRRAFRQLARRYHPDRHPGSSAVEQQRLARLFAEATEHYRVLTAALASPAIYPA
jgi:hypothetical protein